MKPYYLTTALPYVNAAPHLGHAVEFVQADILARHRRLRGQPVRFLSGTDDHALKNVLAARAHGVPVATFVAAAGDRFRAVQKALDISCDDFLRTASDPRHRPGVEYLWRRCAEADDFYRREYAGLYCVGCEQFYDAEALPGGRCPEHGTQPELVQETNWFFRLTAYADRIKRALTDGTVVVNPPQKGNEVLALLDAGLQDFSVSRPASRADGWGIPVPGDPTQVIYVWWDALTNYVTALEVDRPGCDYATWWAGAAARVHVVGKGITRFHAVYWLAILLSAGLPLPTTIHVHDYVTVGGVKLSKSTGNVVDPAALVTAYGVDAVRWWIAREVPLLGDTEFTPERLVHAHDTDLAHGLGNLVNRTLALLRRQPGGALPRTHEVVAGPGWSSATLDRLATGLSDAIDDALGYADFRAAAGHLVAVVAEANRLLAAAQPWQLVRHDPSSAHRLLTRVVEVCRVLAHELSPFCPTGGARLAVQLAGTDSDVRPEPVFRRLADRARET